MFVEFLKLLQKSISNQTLDIEKILAALSTAEIKNELLKLKGVNVNHIVVNLRVYAGKLAKNYSENDDDYQAHQVTLNNLRSSIFSMLQGIVLASNNFTLERNDELVKSSDYTKETRYLSVALKDQIIESVNDLMSDLKEVLEENGLARFIYILKNEQFSNAQMLSSLISQFRNKFTIPDDRELSVNLKRISYNYDEDNNEYGSKEVRQLYSLLIRVMFLRDMIRSQFLYFDFRSYLKLLTRIPLSPIDAILEISDVTIFTVDRWSEKHPNSSDLQVEEIQPLWIPEPSVMPKYAERIWNHNVGMHITCLLQDKLKSLQDNWIRISQFKKEFESEVILDFRVKKAMIFSRELNRHHQKIREAIDFINSKEVYKFFNPRIFKSMRQKLYSLYGEIGICENEVYFYLNRLIHNYVNINMDDANSLNERYGFLRSELYQILVPLDGNYSLLQEFIKNNNLDQVKNLIKFAIERQINEIFHLPQIRVLLINNRSYFSKHAFFLHDCARANNYYLAEQFLYMGYESRRDRRGDYPEAIALKCNSLETFSKLMKIKRNQELPKFGSVLGDDRVFDSLCSKQLTPNFVSIISEDLCISDCAIFSIFKAAEITSDYTLVYALYTFRKDALENWIKKNQSLLISFIGLGNLDDKFKLQLFEILFEISQSNKCPNHNYDWFNLAIKLQSRAIFEYLLNREDVNFSTHDKFGHLPLFSVVSYMTKGDLSYLRLVITHPKTNWDEVKNKYGQTPLEYLNIQLSSRRFEITDEVKSLLVMNDKTKTLLEKVLQAKSDLEKITSSSSRGYHLS